MKNSPNLLQAIGWGSKLFYSLIIMRTKTYQMSLLYNEDTE